MTVCTHGSAAVAVSRESLMLRNYHETAMLHRLRVALWLKLDIPIPTYRQVALTAVATASRESTGLEAATTVRLECNDREACMRSFTTFLLPMDIITPACTKMPVWPGAVPIGNRDRRLPCPPRRTLSCSVSCNGSRFGRLLQVCRLATHQKTPDAAWCRSYAPQLFSRLQSG